MRESIAPIQEGFATHWPDAEVFNVLDDSLSVAASACGIVTDEIATRFLELASYAAGRGSGRAPDGMLITSSAFGKAIEAAKRDFSFPVMGPYEATFGRALEGARRVGLLVTFEPSRSALADELRRMAARRGITVEIRSLLVPGALAALQRGDAHGQNEAIARAACGLADCDRIILGQFSMAQAVKAMPAHIAERVLTTPVGAVHGLREALLARLSH